MGVKIAITRRDEVIDIVREWILERPKTGPKIIVTAYSESILEAQQSPGFKSAIDQADLILADGVSVAAGADFVSKPKSMAPMVGLLKDITRGNFLGIDILRGKYTDKVVTGVSLVDSLCKEASEKGWKVMFLGGWQDAALRAVYTMKSKYPKLKAESLPGPVDIEKSDEIHMKTMISDINLFNPDILLVAFGRFKQEIWLHENRMKLKAKVAIGVGSAFDEISGMGKWGVIPTWVNKMGLKWFWRAVVDPRHISRAFRAFPVFPIKLFFWYRR